ncbi:MAG: hypothetical protein ACERKS_02350 [Candidatus Bathyarchaeota archaeon]
MTVDARAANQRTSLSWNELQYDSDMYELQGFEEPNYTLTAPAHHPAGGLSTGLDPTAGNGTGPSTRPTAGTRAGTSKATGLTPYSRRYAPIPQGT